MVNVNDLIDDVLDNQYKLEPKTDIIDLQNTKLFIILENQIWSVLFTLTRMIKHEI